MKIFLVLVISTVAALAADAPSFEAASIRPAAPSRLPIPAEAWFRGGPGTSDPLRIRYTNATLQDLVARAYGLELLQVTGPGWITWERYDITGTLPTGTTKENLPLMLQGLLIERFKVQMRRESKTFKVYELTIASGGPKLKSAEERPQISDPDELTKRAEADAVAGLQADLALARSGADGFYTRNGTVQWLIRQLSSKVDRPILDRTGLTDSYSFDLKWSLDAMGPGAQYPDLFTAIQRQLGLTLSARNDVLATIVVESAERAPAN